MKDLFKNADDEIDVQPDELGPAFIEVLTSALAKTIASERELPWSEEQEFKLQESFSTLVATATKLGLKTFRLVVTRPNGEKEVKEMDVQRIAKTRTLQS